MEILNNECPTEILVDIKEDRKFVSHVVSKETRSSLNTLESKTKIKCSNIKKYVSSSESCPTAVLVDVSPPRAFCLCDKCVSNSTQYFKEDELNGCKTTDIENQSSHNSSKSSDGQSQMSVKKLRWKTPSPKSMTRISKEASKVIDHLNSSSIFDEDMLLTEEKLPISLNFDELDEDTDQRNSTDNVFEDAILNHKSSVNVQSESEVEKNEKLNCDSSSKDLSPEKILSNLRQTVTEKNFYEESFRVSSKNSSTSKESFSSGIHSNSLGNSDSLTYCDEGDVFNLTHIASEDKENIQIKMNKLVLIKENKISSKASNKNSLMNKQKLDQRGTLRNVSNIKQEASARCLSLSVNKNMTTPLKKMNISTNKKETVPSISKPQVKTPSLSFQNRKELISSLQKPQQTKKIDSGCSSLSSGVKQQNLFATPSRRYSICTPLKSASAIKPPLTPAMNSSHNFAYPRYTPQPVKSSRLSLSSSWQNFANKSQFFGSESLKQHSTIVPSSASKMAYGLKNSSKTGKMSFSQSMSAASVRSLKPNTVSTSRFSSKLNLPSLTVNQNKKVARALFTSVSEQ